MAVKATPIRTKDGKQIGLLKGMTLYKTVQKSRHLFKKVGANGSWGIDYDVLFKQLPERCSVYIRDTEDGILYMARASQWRDYGEVLHFKNASEDHHTQVFLPLEYFTKVKVA